MNQTDDLKLLRLQEEKRYINSDFIEELARQLIDELVRWANMQIFVPRGGELTFDITLGPPNAGVAVHPDRPFHPRMEFRSSLISDIYADSFTFPIVCRRIAQETETLKHFNETEQFRDCHVRFNSPLPDLHEGNVVELFRPVCETFVKLNVKEIERNMASVSVELGRDLRYVVMDVEEYVYRKKMFDSFVNEVLEGKIEILIDKIPKA